MCNATKMVPLRVQAEEPGHERLVHAGEGVVELLEVGELDEVLDHLLLHVLSSSRQVAGRLTACPG